MASIVLMRFNCQKKTNYTMTNYTLTAPNVSLSFSLCLPFSLSFYHRTRVRISAVRLNSGDILDDFHRTSPATGRLLSSSFRCCCRRRARTVQGAAHNHKSDPKWYLLLTRSIRFANPCDFP